MWLIVVVFEFIIFVIVLVLRESCNHFIPVTIDRSANASIAFETFVFSGEIITLLKIYS